MNSALFLDAVPMAERWHIKAIIRKTILIVINMALMAKLNKGGNFIQ
jgi:hypothetical protein